MIDYIFYGLYVMLFLYAVLVDVIERWWITRGSFTIQLLGNPFCRKGDIITTGWNNSKVKVLGIKYEEGNLITKVIVKPIKTKP